MNEWKWLFGCAALAAGEAVAARAPTCSELWPVAVAAAALTVLFGYGLDLPGWRYVALAFLGMALFFQASVASENAYRASPWMRGAKRRAKTVETGNWVRREFSRRVGIGLEHDRAVADLNRAILLGERGGLPWRTKKIFVDSGTMHVFAISGLHVMVVAKVLVTLLVACFVPLRWVGLAAIPLLWGYVAVIGFPPSAVRAALMATFYYSAPMFWRRPNAIMSWALTFGIVYVVTPRMIADVGCSLSFVVMLAIILAHRFAKGLGNGWRMNLWLTFAAWFAGVPIAAHVFGRFTPGGLLANIPLIASAGVTVASGIVGLLVSFVSETLAAHFNNLAALFTHAMVGLSAAVASLPGANFVIAEWSYLQCAAWYALVFLTAYLVRSVRSRHVI